ncbi:MAG: C_GCAxxG_C_C family protein [Bacteroidales bacterium]|nr:C_GCAxxG_C_C family protein [Bacteroidales bacterium]
MNGKVINDSKAYFDSGFGCAESVLKAVADYSGIQSDLIPRIATGFNGGLSNTDGYCGAVTGAILAINIAYGRDHSHQSRDKNYEAVQEFIKRFREKFGAISCRGLTGVDLGSEEGQHRYAILNTHSKCSEFVGEATRMVLEITENNT